MKRPHKLYRNLKPHVNKQGLRWSYKLLQPGKTANHAVSITAYDIKIKQPSGKAFENCLAGGYREVFTWFRAERIEVNEAQTIPPEAVRIFFNPKKQDRYFHTSDGTRVDHMSRVWLTPEGECWALGTR